MDLRKHQREKENTTRLPGLISTSVPRLTQPKQKGQASKQLTTWRYAEHTPSEWIDLLDQGLTIATGQFVTADDGEVSPSEGTLEGDTDDLLRWRCHPRRRLR